MSFERPKAANNNEKNDGKEAKISSLEHTLDGLVAQVRQRDLGEKLSQLVESAANDNDPAKEFGSDELGEVVRGIENGRKAA
jgi:hypothetical protein